MGDGLLTVGVVFVSLKLTAVVHWSWWCVLAPWGACVVSFALIFGTAVLRDALHDHWKRRAVMREVWDEEDETE